MTGHDYIIGSGDATVIDVIMVDNAWKFETICKIVEVLLKIMEDESVSK